MAKATKPGFYAVRNGRNIGVYNTWAECEAQTKGYANAQYKKFSALSDAQHFISPSFSQGPVASQSSVTPSQTQARSTPASQSSKKREYDNVFGIEVPDTTGWDVVYSDGACKGNGTKGSVAGIGVWWGSNDERNIAERCPGDQTNNRAELVAIMRVLETTPISKKPLLIRTDSQYCMSCFKRWIHGWKENKWMTKEGQPVKNAGIIRCISAYLTIRGRLGQKAVLEYVKGHSGDVGNDGADLMANRGSTMSELEDRDWDALEQELEEQIRDMYNVSKTNVQCDSEVEHRSKMRKLSPESSMSISSSMVVNPLEVNFDDFADCLLDDDDLASEVL